MIAKCKSKEEAFSYPITSLPLSIANPDGSLYSSNKAQFRNLLISQSVIDSTLLDAMWIIDAGYAIRQVNPKDTYKEYYTDLLSWMLPERTSRPSSVVIAVDDYRTESVKDGERRKRRGGEDREEECMLQG